MPCILFLNRNGSSFDQWQHQGAILGGFEAEVNLHEHNIDKCATTVLILLHADIIVPSNWWYFIIIESYQDAASWERKDFWKSPWLWEEQTNSNHSWTSFKCSCKRLPLCSFTFNSLVWPELNSFSIVDDLWAMMQQSRFALCIAWHGFGDQMQMVYHLTVLLYI